jgi:hypothetical protein
MQATPTKKNNVRAKKIIVLAVMAGIVIGILVAISSGGSKTKAPTATTTATKTATKAAPKAPTASIASLNAEAVPILTAETNYYAQLMSTGQADATQSNAANASSAFHQFYEKQTTTADTTGTDAYNKASNLYTAANQATPDAVNNWNDDSQQMYSDITTWSQDEYTLLVDQLMGNSTSSDKAKVTTDLQTYQTDLAKTKADISQL